MSDDRNLAVIGERVLGRHDEAPAPGKAGRSCALGLDGDEARRGGADEVGERRREGEQGAVTHLRNGRIGKVWRAARTILIPSRCWRFAAEIERLCAK
jgi:hypothetical protein